VFLYGVSFDDMEHIKASPPMIIDTFNIRMDRRTLHQWRGRKLKGVRRRSVQTCNKIIKKWLASVKSSSGDYPEASIKELFEMLQSFNPV
jgi:hypothetical protein